MSLPSFHSTYPSSILSSLLEHFPSLSSLSHFPPRSTALATYSRVSHRWPPHGPDSPCKLSLEGQTLTQRGIILSKHSPPLVLSNVPRRHCPLLPHSPTSPVTRQGRLLGGYPKVIYLALFRNSWRGKCYQSISGMRAVLFRLQLLKVLACSCGWCM